MPQAPVLSHKQYHPMDDVTRPKRAARHRPSTVHDDQAETDEETLPSSARHSDARTDSEEDESSGEDSGEVTRVPDPKATRHSTRPSKAKTVNYSAKHHPQDYGLPGFQHKAKLQKMALKRATKISRSSKSPLNAIDLSKEEATGTESLEEAAREGDAIDGAEARPRKKLRSLEDDRETGNAKKSKKSTRTMREVKNNSMPLSDSIADSLKILIEVAKEGVKTSDEQFEGMSSSHTNESERYSDDGGFMPRSRSDATENDKNEPSKLPAGSLLVPNHSPSDLEEQIAITEKAASQDLHPKMTFDAPPNGIARSSSTPATQRSDLNPDKGTSLTSNDGPHQELHNSTPFKHTTTGAAQQQHLTNKVQENNLVGARSGSFAESFSGTPAADTDEEILSPTQ